MKCVALLSGGKDSVAAVDVARQHGWRVDTALCMRPAQDDAWMFHVPNIGLAPAVAQCLGMEVVEAEARPDPEDEVEDLERALADIQQRRGVQGVLSGALASEYQRTRIDRIGHRLGLKTFAPLWRKEPRQYVRDLVEGGWDIRFSRVAAEGLGEDWAGAPLDAQALQRLEAMRPAVHVAGEGGEFETLVLDAPCFTSRVVVEEAHVEASASRATWVVDRWRVEAKGG